MSQSKSYTVSSLERYPLSNKPILVITHKLQQQIDYLHKQVGRAEWSGELITREVGAITDLEKWKVIAEDIWLADVGSPGFTGYEVDKGGFKSTDIVEMFEAFPGLMDGTLKNHHIHTHHSMGAFFSGTDESNLEDRASQSNYFIMLVVDFQKKYMAKVAFKAEIKGAGGTAIHFVNNHDDIEPMHLTQEREREVLVVMEMDIKFEAAPSIVEDSFKARYEAVKTAIENDKPKVYSGYGGTVPGFRGTNYGKGSSFHHPASSHQPTFDWDADDRKKDKRKGKKRGRKPRIMEMTDQEFREYEKTFTGNQFEIRHATAIVNAVLDKDTSEPNYRPCPNRLYNLDYELKTESKKSDWAEGFVASVPDMLFLLFGQGTAEAQVAIGNKLIELLTPYMHTEVIRMMVTLLTELVVEISEAGMQDDEQDRSMEANIDSYNKDMGTDTNYSDETPAATAGGDLADALEESEGFVNKNEYLNEHDDLDDFNLSKGNLFY
jgi:hypothetical protein